jgi:hypothetical protein
MNHTDDGFGMWKEGNHLLCNQLILIRLMSPLIIGHNATHEFIEQRNCKSCVAMVIIDNLASLSPGHKMANYD